VLVVVLAESYSAVYRTPLSRDELLLFEDEHEYEYEEEEEFVVILLLVPDSVLLCNFSSVSAFRGPGFIRHPFLLLAS
jgi:hypothetical protein